MKFDDHQMTYRIFEEKPKNFLYIFNYNVENLETFLDYFSSTFYNNTKEIQNILLMFKYS